MTEGKYWSFNSIHGGSRPKRPAVQMSPAVRMPPVHFNLSPLLSKGERGGLLTPPMTIEVEGRSVRPVQKVPINYGSVKLALLFVDKIDVPATNIMFMKPDYVDQLEGFGISSQSVVNLGNDSFYEMASSFAWRTLCKLDDREPGRWSIWQQPDMPLIPAELLTPNLAFQLELTNGLIVPDENTPYEDVLTFKTRHNDELIAVRHYLEEFAIKLSKEGDPRAINLERERFDNSLSEYLKKARESNIKRAVASLTTELDWAAAVRSAVGGGGGGGLLATAQGLSLTHTAAAIGGGVLASLSIKSVAGLKDGPSPFRYIARIEREYGG